MISLDTNVVVRLFVDTDPEQTLLAERLIENNDKVAIANVALIETIYVLTVYYGHDRAVASACIMSLLENPKVNCNRPLFNKSLRLYEAHPALSIEDCCLATYAQLNRDTPLMTFDRKLAKQTQFSELIKL